MHYSWSELQAHAAALEHSLVDERERCNAERQKRKELHNTLVVRTDYRPSMSGYLTGNDAFSFTPSAGVKREHQGSLQGASSSALWSCPILFLRIQVSKESSLETRLVWHLEKHGHSLLCSFSPASLERVITAISDVRQDLLINFCCFNASLSCDSFVDSRTRWWWTASSQECWGSTRCLSLRGKDENELGMNSQLTGNFLRLLTHFFQGSWTRGFPECSVWGSEAPPHVSARWVSVKHPR